MFISLKKKNDIQFFFNFKIESQLNITNYTINFLDEKNKFTQYNIIFDKKVSYTQKFYNNKILITLKLKIYILYFIIYNFFIKTKAVALHRNFSFFILSLRNTIFNRRQHFNLYYFNINLYTFRFFINFFTSNYFFNKLFFEFNFFKFKTQDFLNKNLYFLYNFFTKSKLKKNTAIYSDLDLNELYNANTSIFPQSCEYEDLKSLIFGAPSTQNVKSYLNFFQNINEESYRFISPESVFDIVNKRRHAGFKKFIPEKYIAPYNYKYVFLNFRYLFNQILKFTIFQNFEEFLNKKYRVLTCVFLEDDSFFDSINFF